MQFVKYDLATFVYEELKDGGELSVMNLIRKWHQLRTRQEAKNIRPSLQWEITKNGNKPVNTWQKFTVGVQPKNR
jgi:hypothetical protein